MISIGNPDLFYALLLYFLSLFSGFTLLVMSFLFWNCFFLKSFGAKNLRLQWMNHEDQSFKKLEKLKSSKWVGQKTQEIRASIFNLFRNKICSFFVFNLYSKVHNVLSKLWQGLVINNFQNFGKGGFRFWTRQQFEWKHEGRSKILKISDVLNEYAQG